MLITFWIAAAIALAALAISICFSISVRSPFGTTLIALIIFTCGLGAICGHGASVAADMEHELAQTYKELSLYQPIVEACEDEVVRFDFYCKVLDYNELYATYLAKATSPAWEGIYEESRVSEISVITVGGIE